LAARNGQLECVQALLEGELRSALALALETDRAGQTVLMAAVLRNDNDMALWLLRRFGKALAVAANLEDVLPLHVAAGQG
jgi:ankyrin repeat protein